MIDLIFYTAAGFGIFYYLFNVKKENGYVYAKFPFAHRNAGGSLANPIDVKRGYKWTPVSNLKRKFRKNKKNKVFIDQFRFDEEYVDKSKMNYFAKKSAEKTEMYFDPLQMTQGVLLVGKMGSGKTELYFSILKQKFYNRAIVHQVKAGDFASVFLRKRDILFSTYDTRGWMWDILSEEEGIIKTFFTNYANAVMGDKKDFFSASSERLYNELAQKIKSAYAAEDSAVKWKLFIKSIKDLFAEMDSGSQKSKQDVKSTMESILEPLEIMAYKMQDPKQKRFIIKDFFKMKNQRKLILDNIPEHEKSLTPLFSAFTACISQIHCSLPDSKTDFTLYALDEYLSLAEVMDEPSKKRLHTLIRSKGGILMPAVQYVPKDNQKLQQLLTSSAYAWIYFSVIDDQTIDLLKKTIGEVEYVWEDHNESRDAKGKKSRSSSTKTAKDPLIYNELINGLGENFEHLVYLPNHKMIYKGYTPQVELKEIAEKQIAVDLSPFYAMKYKNEEKIDKQELRNLTFEDLFKEKPISKPKQWEKYKKYLKAKETDTVEKFAEEEELVNVDFDVLFKDFIPNDKVINNKMKILTIDDRIKLAEEWNAISDDNYEAQVAFIEKHDLWGACPAIFKFTDEQLEEYASEI